MRQVIAGEGGLVASAFRGCDRSVPGSDGGGNRNSFAERSTQTLSCRAWQRGSERDAGGFTPAADHLGGQEGAHRSRPVRAVAPCEEGRGKHRAGAIPAAV